MISPLSLICFLLLILIFSTLLFLRESFIDTLLLILILLVTLATVGIFEAHLQSHPTSSPDSKETLNNSLNLRDSIDEPANKLEDFNASILLEAESDPLIPFSAPNTFKQN